MSMKTPTGPAGPDVGTAASEHAPDHVSDRVSDRVSDHGPALRRILVGFGGDERSRDAVRLGVQLAQASGATLRIQLIIRQDASFTPAYPPVGDVQDIIAEQARGWLAEAERMIPSDVEHSSGIRRAASVAEGLIAAAEELDADLLVTGSGVGSRRLTTHPAVNALLHSSPVPLALAPAGHTGGDPVSHVFAAISADHAVHQVTDDAASWAEQLQVPVSHVTFHAGDTTAVDWPDGGVLLIGSSRLAGRRRLFLGDTAARILTQLPIPLIVMPRHDTPAHRSLADHIR